ncbi:MAG TPA: hypothetical protein VFM40_01170 [Actinomycetota bacterium]|nr:hypothetical protein [Actinomycetota bacterium]
MSRRTAIVADRRPLERGLARFLLEERGLFVVGEAATMADVLLQVQQLKPDLVVLHEKLALDHDPTVVAQIRRISARTSVVLLAASRDALPAELILLTDTVVEDGPGLTGLGTAVAGPATEIDTASGTEPVDAKAIAVAPPARSSGSRWADRLQGLAVASIIALALVVARDMTTPTLVPPVVGRAHLVAAWDSLDELESALTDATPDQIAEIASALIDDRAAAEASGISVSTLDQALVETLTDVWPTLPPETQDLLLGLFGDIIGHDQVSLPPPLPASSPEPTASPQPEPEPTPSPSGEPEATEASVLPPSATPSPEPTETTTPPGETTTPPVETTTPPAETTTPPPTESTTPPAETTTPPPETTTSPVETTTTPAETTTTPAETTTTPPETTTTPAETSTTPAETSTTPAETTTAPAETTTPPAETTTSPAETTTPPAVQGETRTWSLALIPFALSLLLAISGWARRRSGDGTGGPHGPDRS